MFTKLRNKSIISKIVSITILAFIVLLIGVLISTKMNIEDTIEKTISRHGAEVATSISKKIDSDKYEEFLDDKTETKTYFELREDLNEYRELMGALFLYTVEYDESTKKVRILVDGFPLEGEGEILSDIGSVTSTVTYDLIEPALNGEISYTDVIEDDLTGSYVSSFVPIKNSSGKVIGVLGMDIPADVVSTIVGDLTHQSVIDVLILSLILIVVIVLVLYTRIRAMLLPLKAVELANSFVADNDLNEAEKALSNVTIKNYDEVGNLYLATKKMVDNLKSIVERVTHGATTVQDVTKELEETVEETKNALNIVQGAVTTLVDNSNSTSEASSESSTVTGEMAIAVTRVAESTSLVAEKSHESLSQANKGFETIEEVIGQVIHLRDATDDSTKSIERLTGYLEDIEKVLMAIKGIADQTNLLSLNASIEAARAGEHGKGFAVVAHEVRKLSDESKHAVGEITNLLANINSSSRQVVVSMQQGVVEVNKGLDMANSAGDIFKDLLSKTEEVTSELQEVSAAVEQISASSEEISATLQELSSISKHSSSNAVEVGQLTEKQLSHMEQANSVAYELNGAVEELKGVIATFKV